MRILGWTRKQKKNKRKSKISVPTVPSIDVVEEVVSVAPVINPVYGTSIPLKNPVVEAASTLFMEVGEDKVFYRGVNFIFLNPDPPILELTPGDTFRFKTKETNTGEVKAQINLLPEKDVKDIDGQPFTAGDLLADRFATMVNREHYFATRLEYKVPIPPVFKESLLPIAPPSPISGVEVPFTFCKTSPVIYPVYPAYGTFIPSSFCRIPTAVPMAAPISGTFVPNAYCDPTAIPVYPTMVRGSFIPISAKVFTPYPVYPAYGTVVYPTICDVGIPAPFPVSVPIGSGTFVPPFTKVVAYPTYPTYTAYGTPVIPSFCDPTSISIPPIVGSGTFVSPSTKIVAYPTHVVAGTFTPAFTKVITYPTYPTYSVYGTPVVPSLCLPVYPTYPMYSVYGTFVPPFTKLPVYPTYPTYSVYGTPVVPSFCLTYPTYPTSPMSAYGTFVPPFTKIPPVYSPVSVLAGTFVPFFTKIPTVYPVIPDPVSGMYVPFADCNPTAIPTSPMLAGGIVVPSVSNTPKEPSVPPAEVIEGSVTPIVKPDPSVFRSPIPLSALSKGVVVTLKTTTPSSPPLRLVIGTPLPSTPSARPPSLARAGMFPTSGTSVKLLTTSPARPPSLARGGTPAKITQPDREPPHPVGTMGTVMGTPVEDANPPLLARGIVSIAGTDAPATYATPDDLIPSLYPVIPPVYGVYGTLTSSVYNAVVPPPIPEPPDRPGTPTDPVPLPPLYPANPVEGTDAPATYATPDDLIPSLYPVIPPVYGVYGTPISSVYNAVVPPPIPEPPDRPGTPTDPVPLPPDPIPVNPVEGTRLTEDDTPLNLG